jgi:DNA-directed RNA polymerase specialized sigma24 family protein
MDGHNGRAPPPVWRPLEYALCRAPNVSGVVFEVLDQFAPRLGREAITEELRRARAVWERSEETGGTGLVEVRETERVVRGTLSELPERDRRLLQAVVLEERDKDEICAELGLTRE